MVKAETILYLSNQDLEDLSLSMTEIVSILEEMFLLQEDFGKSETAKEA